MTEEIRPFSPRALYLAAHHAQWSGAYFQRVVLAARLADHPDPTLARYQSGLVRALKEEAPHAAALVVLADRLARAHGIEAPHPPRVPDAWAPWVDALSAGFRRQFGLARPQDEPFRFGWELGQVRTTLATLVTTAEIVARGLDLRATLDAGVRDLGTAARRWPQTTPLLAQVPSASALIATWQPALDELRRLGQASVGAMDAEGVRALADGAARLLEALAAVDAAAAGLSPEPA